MPYVLLLPQALNSQNLFQENNPATSLRHGLYKQVVNMANTLDGIGEDLPVDPDAQATITDFLDYTEYLPSDLTRSLTLIGKLDESYLNFSNKVHELTKAYGSLPAIPANKRKNSQHLRYLISHDLEHAINARESSYAEATRLYDVVDRHYNRLTSIISKLHALPKPPSRDPTPAPQASSPQASRARPGLKGETDRTPPPRITLRLDGPRSVFPPGRASATAPRLRYRSRKVTVPGEVLPPPNPDSPPPITDSEWESIPPSPIPMPTSRVGLPARSRSSKPGRVRLPKVPKPHRTKIPKVPRPPRPPGAMGTNVHSAVAGISTSNALSLLSPPPPDAKPGSEHAPWMRLTEWEMAKLRKRMKKNAIWTPSETMIRRELSDAGRGPENYRMTKAKCDATGEKFVDDDNIATTAPGKQLVPGEISADSLGLGEIQLSNRGMKLNEAKKLKREILAREQAALAAAEAEQAAKRLGDIGSTFKSLFNQHVDEFSEISTNVGQTNGKEAAKAKEQEKEKDKEVSKTSAKKRKRDATPKDEETQAQTENAAASAKPTPKKRKTVPSQPAVPLTITTTTSTIVPLAAAAPSPPRATTPTQIPPPTTATKKTTTTSTRPRRASITLKGPAPIPTPAKTPSRPASRSVSRRASAGPPETTGRERLRRKSTTPAPAATPILTAASTRSKRPAPGPVTSSQDGGAAVSVGRRQNAPRKRGTAAAANAKKAAEGAANAREREEQIKAEEEAAGEEIDPDEPRYCVCGDVSFGTMICCENSEVSTVKIFFSPFKYHLSLDCTRWLMHDMTL